MSPVKKAATFAGEDLMATIRPPSPEQLDHAVIRAIFGSLPQHKAARFHALLHSDEDGKAGSPSEADFALFCFLALGTRDEEQIERIARTSGRAREKWDKHRSYLARSITHALDTTWDEYTKRQATPPPEDAEGATALKLTLCEYLKDPDALKPPEPVIPRLAWPGHITLLASPEGWGKSTHTRAGCAAVTTGQPFLDGKPVPPGDILWALLEEPVATCMISAHRFGMDANRFTTWRKPGPDAVGELVAEIQAARPLVTVIDSIQELAIMAGVDNLDDAVQVGRALMPLVDVCRDTQTAMIWLAQANKATGKYRNSSWFGHQADVSLDIAEPDEDSGLRKIVKRKTRIDGIRSYKVELVANAYRLVLGDEDGLDGTRLTVRNALPKDTGLSDTDWKRASGKAGVSETSYKRHKRWLTNEGYVVKRESLWHRHMD